MHQHGGGACGPRAEVGGVSREPLAVETITLHCSPGKLGYTIIGMHQRRHKPTQPPLQLAMPMQHNNTALL